MASGFTNKGMYRILGYVFRGDTIPTNLYIALCTDAVTPDEDTNTFSQLTEVPAGNGYTAGGIQLTPGATDFDTHTEDDTGNLGYVQLKDIVWTASGGNLPSSGNGARWAILTDDNGTQGSREILAWFDLGSNRIVSNGQQLSLIDFQLTAKKPA